MQVFYRMADVNLNRAREGLRVIEELARLVLSDRDLTAHCRDLRHFLSGYASLLPGGEMALVQSRNAPGDVGAPLWPGEKTRAGLDRLAYANFKRVQEAARVLEEVAKVLDWPVAELKEFRFNVYDLEKNMMSKLNCFMQEGQNRCTP